MKLAYLTSQYARASDSFVRLEVRLLRQMGHEVHTFSIRRPIASEIVGEEVLRERAATEDILHAGVVRLLGATLRVLVRRPDAFLGALGLAWRTSTPGLKGLIWSAAYVVEAAFLAERLIARQVEHLHNHLAENSATVSMLAHRMGGPPFSITIHGPSEFDRPSEFALGVKVRHATLTAVISQFTRSQVMRWCEPADWSKLEVVRCGLDRDFLDFPFTPLPTSPTLVFVGRLAGVKGALVLVEALARLAAEAVPYELIMIGDGPQRPAIEALIAERGLRERIQLVGWRDAAGVRASILDARLMVLPSFAEGLPVVLMEALALGRPVISTYIAGIPELVLPGINGWLAPPGSVDDLVVALRDALGRSTEELERMGRAGMARVRERHNAAIEIARLESLFLRVRQDQHPSRQRTEPTGYHSGSPNVNTEAVAATATTRCSAISPTFPSAT